MSQGVVYFLVPFSRYNELLVENHKFFLPHVYLAPALGIPVVHLDLT